MEMLADGFIGKHLRYKGLIAQEADMETRPEDKKARGRPIRNEVEPIPDTARNIAKAIFRDADKRIVKSK